MIFKFIFRRKKKKLQEEFKHKTDINNWMDLSKEERLEIDFRDKDESMRKKKELLKSIREEYIKIKNNQA